MSRVDPSDPAIEKAYNAVIDENDPTDWLLLGYVPRNNTKLRVLSTGDDGWMGMCDELGEGKVQYGLCRFKINEVWRFAYLAWCGEGVQGLMRGQFNNHSCDMQRVFEGYHVQINARCEEDLDEEIVTKKLGTAIGAAYHAGQADQSTQSSGNPAPRNTPQQKGPIIDPEASNKFWESQRSAESAPASGYKKDLSFQKASGAGGLKNKFEQLIENERPDQPPPRQAKPMVQLPTGPAIIAESTPAPSVHKYERSEPAPPPAAAAQSYPEEQYYEESYPEESYPEESYPEESYPEESYAEESYPEESYPEETYAEESYAEESYPEESYAEESYAEEEYYEEEYAGGEGEGGELWAVALYDYAGQAEDDLAFSAGDQIRVLDQSDPTGWWKGELNGYEGYFPSNFVQLN